MKMTRTILGLVAALACAVGTGHAQTLMVDIGRSEDPLLQAGWQEWNITGNSFSSTPRSNSFTYSAATGGNLNATLTPGSAAGGRKYGLDNVTDPGNLTIPNVWADQYFFNNNTGSSLTLTLDNLLAGTYDFTSYSYADDLAASSNDDGLASVQVDTGGGFVDTGLDVRFVSGGNGYSPVTASLLDSIASVSFSFTVDNDGDSVDILYGPLSDGDTFGLNGFQVQRQVVPEPTAIAIWSLIGLGLAVFGYLRARRKR